MSRSPLSRQGVRAVASARPADSAGIQTARPVRYTGYARTLRIRTAARRPLLALALTPLPAILGCDDEAPWMAGFTREGSAAQAVTEALVLGEPDGDRMLEYHRELTREPHHAGTPANEATAEYIAERLREFGFDLVETYAYEVLLPRPVERSVTLLGSEPYELMLAEPPLDEDPDTGKRGVLPPFNAFSPDGEATGQVVYVNYGMPDDYRVLDSLGVSVRDRIVLVRYGEGWRGIKPRLAAEHGAVGALIYSDPEDDGFEKGRVMPNGKWRPRHGVQRGSVMDMPTYPGDPQTPGRPSTPDAARLPLDSLPTVPRIPVQPISWGDASPILEALEGPEAPEGWQGGLDATYRIGPGPAQVQIELRFDWSTRRIVNVIGTLLGGENPDQVIMAGGHRDAWTFGGRDPMSGAVSLLESARAIAGLALSGSRPRRSIAIASWDAEEYGLIGSTEYGEEFAEVLPGRIVTYINRESYTEGAFSAAGSHALQPLVNEVARTVAMPRIPELTVFDSWKQRADSADAADALEDPSATRRTVRQGLQTDVRIGALGSGSDYTVFIDHLGIPSLNLGFSSGNGIYHSRYDTHWYFTRYGDPDFETGERLAELVAVLMLRLANADVLPFDFTATTETVDRYLDELEREARDRRVNVSLRDVRAANETLALNAAGVNAAIDRILSNRSLAAQRAGLIVRLNEILLGTEQAFLDPNGLPGRPWYRHQLYAPGFYTGYGVKTLPAVREAIEAEDVRAARDGVVALEAALRRAAERLGDALALVEGIEEG